MIRQRTRTEVGDGGSDGLSDVSHCSHDPTLLHDIRGPTFLSSKMSGTRHDYLVSLVSTFKGSRIITSLNLASQLYWSLWEMHVEKHLNPTYLHRLTSDEETPPENGRTAFREEVNYSIFLSTRCSFPQIRVGKAPVRGVTEVLVLEISRTCLVWSEYYHSEGEISS